MNLKGHFLVPTPKNPDKGLWFIFHHESDGILAFDLTCEHPDIPYRHFAEFSETEPREKAVLLGGPDQNDSALLILHNDPKAADSHTVNGDFSFISRRFVLMAGHPPALTTADNAPSRIDLAPTADFIVSLGFRLWNMEDMERELAEWQWNFLPAAPEIVFHTRREDRLDRVLRSIN